MQTISDVIIIGAGASGLYLGYILKKQGLRVRILEASKRAGGRIRTDYAFAGIPIELGAEYIHGKKSVLMELAEHQGLPIRKEARRFFYKIKNDLLLYDEAMEHQAFAEIAHFFDHLYQYRGADISIADYFRQKPYYAAYKSVIEAYACVYGASAEQIGTYSTAKADRLWSSGHTNYFFKGPYSGVLQAFVADLDEEILLEKQAVHVQYAKQPATVTCSDLSRHQAKYVVVTVPLGVLKAGDMAFFPALPAAVSQAIDQLGFGPGLKVFFRFRQRIWEVGTAEINGGDFAPSYYVREDADKGVYLLIAYVMGRQATFLASIGEKIPRLLLQELDILLGSGAASAHFMDWKLMDWGSEPFAQGAYSYRPPGSADASLALTHPIGERLFFAGEATHADGHHATVHGAMETAERVAGQLFEAMEISPNFPM